MRRYAFRFLLFFIPISLLSMGATSARELTFEERVAAQEAIERVYYSHEIGATKSFEEAVSREVLEKKVRTYLRQSAALELYWNTPVTREMLQEEMIRIAHSTRFPSRLGEIYAALGNDSFVIQECLARPALVDRLSRSFFWSDERIQGSARREAEGLRARLADGEVSPLTDAPNRTVMKEEMDPSAVDMLSPNVPRTGAQSGAMAPVGPGAGLLLSGVDETGASRSRSDALGGETATVLETRDAFFVRVPLDRHGEDRRLAVYSFPKVRWDSWWEAHQNDFDESGVASAAGDSAPVAGALAALGSGHVGCIAGDSWSDGGLNPGIPDARGYHVAVWTGSVMVIWGGATGGQLPNPQTNTGGRYDPLTDEWMPMSTEGAPPGSARATAVWTGHEMIVWGGEGGVDGKTFLGTGGRYDPVRDVWAPVSMIGAPSPRIGHSAVWTGRTMIVWGGYEAANVTSLTGGRYDPASDTWTPTSLSFPSPTRAYHRAVWTGNVMIVWGGVSQYLSSKVWPTSGGRYNPLTDTWQSMSVWGAPIARERFSAVWTGTEMLVQAGLGACVPDSRGFCAQPNLKTGGRYDPVLDQWQPMASVDMWVDGPGQSAIWTGREMVIWGAVGSNYGARYDPVADHWTRISTVNAPSTRSHHTAVWTGELMIVWGGTGLPSGGRYNLASDTWTPTNMPDFLTPRAQSSAVWTGSEMIFWGGNSVFHGYDVTREGSRYDPLLDQWSPTATVNAPRAREQHVAVWTGNSMIIWGGNLGLYYSYPLNTGGRYDPRSDSWSATSSSGVPAARLNPSVVWSGSRMIIWGGTLYGGSYTNTGGQYDPVADNWTPVSTVDAPVARSGHSAVWTGTEMIVWGGTSGDELNSGGRYDPTLDRWSPTTLDTAPAARQAYSSVWTGTEMLIWGGIAGSQGMTSGALYNPTLDSWRSISQADAPSERSGQTAIWTGKEMIVWGGQVNNEPLSTGGRYDPSRDQWMPTNDHNAPEARWDHTAVWTGEMMIVWGGPYSRSVATGGRYFPYPAGQQIGADAGGDLIVECAGPDGTAVQLSGTGSSCDDSAALSFSWSGPFPEGGGVAAGQTPMVTLALGTSTLTLRVDDGLGHSATDTMTVSVRDTLPPALTCPSVEAAECTSPEGAVVTISPAQAMDICDAHPNLANSWNPGGADPSGTFPLGQTEVVMTATDASGNQSSCTFPVTVQDTTPPRLSSSVSSSILWPPNHRLVELDPAVSATDACSAPTVILTSVISSEPDDAPGSGDGNTTGDIQGAEIGTADYDFQLRAERDGGGEGRAYRVTYTATDGSGNQSSAESIVYVPHDLGGGTEPLVLSTENTPAGTILRWDPVPGASSYKVIRGAVGGLKEAGDIFDLGTVSCIAPSSPATDTLGHEDAESPALGEAFFYLVAYSDGRDSGYGSDTASKPRIKTGGGCE